MKLHILAAILIAAPSATAIAQNSSPFVVANIIPGHKTEEVELEPLIQIHLSEKFDPTSLRGDCVRLHRTNGKQIKTKVSGDLGGVITLSVASELDQDTEYELVVTSAIKSLSGKSIRPVKVRFRTTDKPPATLRDDIASFRFSKHRLERRDGVCGLAISGTQLFACTWDGKLIRYQTSEDGSLVGEPEVSIERPRRFNAIVADPRSTPSRVLLWISHDSQHRLSVGPNDYSGTISRITIQAGKASIEDIVTGLPTGDHPASGLTFGPDGRLFVSQGALSMLGGEREKPETPLSAATLAIDLADPLWQGDTPVDVRAFQPETNPKALQVFATGIREAFDLCWHSSGQLFAGVNMNDTKDATPGNNGLPAVSVRPAEMMLRIAEGKYYGHPNPSRDEWVLLGGNPTDGVDPWEVPELPVGTMPEPEFDHSLLIRNLERDKGPSADGVCEWTSDGALRGRLLYCFYTATRGIHTYRVIESGTAVSDHQPLVGNNNQILRFGAPLDIIHDSRGWLYVADFSAPERGDSGTAGGVWLVKPITPKGTPKDRSSSEQTSRR